VPVFVALLRAINVGKAGRLAMSDLARLCEDANFTSVKTYIQSGNVVFKSSLTEAKVKARLEKALTAKMQRASSVLVRTATELDAVIQRNPFRKAAPNRLLVLFLDQALPRGALDGLKIDGPEQVKASGREVFIHYPDGMGRSKLKLPLSQKGTSRNLNTVMKLAAMARAIESV
jgi:uncharacterized protein (DUF1697 family)